MSVITLSVAAAAWGQTFESKEMPKNYGIILKPLAYEGKSSIVIWSEDDENTVDVYDSNLEKVRSFTITPSSYQQVRTEQLRKYEVKEKSKEMEMIEPGYWGDATSYVENGHGDFLESIIDEGNHTIIPKYDMYSYLKYNRYGYLYPKIYYKWNPTEEDPNYGTLYKVTVEYEEVPTDEWETIKEENNTITIGMNNLSLFDYYIDYDNNVFYDGYYFTQTLFNTDEKIEYILPLYEDSENIFESYDSERGDMRIIISGTIQTGYKVVNEDGATLFTISDRDRNLDYPIIEKLGNKTYMVSYAYDHTTWYLIDQQSSSIESVKRIPTGKSQIYSVDGRKLNNTQRGINIIRKDDGSSTKQLIR